MRVPLIRGLIERRLLINYRVDPEILSAVLPPPFRPQVFRGYGLAGICLIRLNQVRPQGVPAWCGIRSENAAHRVAVEWEKAGERWTGVYVLRRDTNSRLNAAAGGRIFPGVHHFSRFQVRETARRFDVAVESRDRAVSLRVAAGVTTEWPRESVFDSLSEASSFFEAGSVGYSPSRIAGRFQGLELRCRSWTVTPLNVEAAASSLFDDTSKFPPGSIHLDCGLLMQYVEHEWRAHDELCCHDYAAAGSGWEKAVSATSA